MGRQRDVVVSGRPRAYTPQRDVVAAGALHDMGTYIGLCFGPTNHPYLVGLQPFVFDGVVAVDQPAKWAPQEMDSDDGSGANQGEHQMPGGGQHSDRGRAPKRGSRVQTADVEPLPQNDPAAQESNSRNHVGRHSGGAAVLGGDRVQHEQGSTGRHQSVGAQPSHPRPPLALEPDNGPATHSDGQPESEIGDSQRLHDAESFPIARRRRQPTTRRLTAV